MHALIERWTSQACLIYGRRVREPVPEGRTAGDALLMRWADLEYSADDGGDVRRRYSPGAMPLTQELDAPASTVEFILGTLEISGSLGDGTNAFRRHESYPADLVAKQQTEFDALAELFAEDFDEIALDEGPAWHLVPGPAREAHLFFGAPVTEESTTSLPEGVLQQVRGVDAAGTPHPRVVVGARLAHAATPQVVDGEILQRSYATVTRVLRTFWPKAKPGFFVVATSAAADPSIYVEPEA
ncbi:MAG: hypothetical protein AAGE52_12860 [Myxococcota bacterium]